MPVFVHELLLAWVAIVALGRVAGILILKFARQGRYEERALVAPRSWRDRCTVPEPYLLGLVTLLLAFGADEAAAPAGAAAARVGAAALLSLVAMVLMLWTLRVFPSVSTGHYVLPEQRVVSGGPYALVRHPLYLAAFLVWLSVALAWASWPAFLIAALYVIPGYWIYMRSEEAMLVESLGEPYLRYRERVGMLLPRVGRGRAGS